MTFHFENLCLVYGQDLLPMVIFAAPIFFLFAKDDPILALISGAIGHIILVVMVMSLVYYKKCIYPKEMVELKASLVTLEGYLFLIKDVTKITIQDVTLLTKSTGERVKAFLDMPTYGLFAFESLQMISMSFLFYYIFPTVLSTIHLINSMPLFTIKQRAVDVVTFLILILFSTFIPFFPLWH